MGGEMGVTVPEWRVVDNGGAFYVMANHAQARVCASQWDDQDPARAPHRVQSRTVTTTEWKDVPDV